jgi:anhydro-N-acetylmuramic acid kinase
MIVVGLMSGTSLDGISAAVVRFRDDGPRVEATLLGFDVAPYDAAQRERLGRALEGGTPEEYCRLNFDLGEWLAAAAVRVLSEAGVARGDVAGIASHGQTIWHVPGHSTWQLGEGAVIAERTSCPVISDFRVADVAAGGQGAPLVSMADRLLFSAPATWRALQNIGGIGNVTVVPPGGSDIGLRAFDTGPGVVVIDAVARMVDPTLRFDLDGRLARQGRAVHAAVEAALDDPYFLAPPPKTTGREFFDAEYIRRFVGACRAADPGATGPDLVASAVQLTARAVASGLRHFVPEPVAELVVSGGGARNPALVEAIAHGVAPLPVRRFDDLFFDGEAKEAVAFALLGYLHLTGRHGNVPAATGARGGRVLGKRCGHPTR